MYQFVDIGSRECYVGMLYACYDLIPLHTVMELSWRHGLNDFTMVSTMRLCLSAPLIIMLAFHD